MYKPEQIQTIFFYDGEMFIQTFDKFSFGKDIFDIILNNIILPRYYEYEYLKQNFRKPYDDIKLKQMKFNFV